MKRLIIIGLLACFSLYFSACSDNGNDSDELELTITSPAVGDTVSGIIVATAECDPEPDFIQFTFDAFPAVYDSTAPFTTNSTVSLYTQGFYTLTANAVKDGETETKQVTFYISTAGTLWVSVTTPTENDTVSGTFTIRAETGSGPDYVEFYFDTLTLTDNTYPYEISIDGLYYTSGLYAVMVKAYWGSNFEQYTRNFYISAPTSEYFPVLVEDFTNTNCIPCLNVANALSSVRNNYSTMSMKPTMIEFHPQIFPNDPFRIADPQLHDGRGAFYGFTSVPQLVINGINLPISEATDADAILYRIEEQRAVAHSAIIAAVVTETEDSIYTEGYVEAVTAISNATLRAYVVRVHTEFSIAPGSNGLREFFDVAAIAVNSLDGVPISLGAGERMLFDYETELPRAILTSLTSDYAVVLFVQDNTTKSVLGATMYEVE